MQRVSLQEGIGDLDRNLTRDTFRSQTGHSQTGHSQTGRSQTDRSQTGFLRAALKVPNFTHKGAKFG